MLALLIVGFLTGPGYALSWTSAGAAFLFFLSFAILRGKVPPSVLFMISAALAVLLGRLIV